MNDGLEYLGRARTQGLVLLVLTFVVGVLAGAAGDRLLTARRAPERPPREQRDERGGRPRLPRVLEEMDLTATQRAAIDSVLASGRPRNEAAMQAVLPRLRAISDSLHAGIRAVLTPAQARAFDEYLRTHRAPELDAARPPRDDGEPGVRPPRDDRAPDDGARPPRADDRRPPPRDERGRPPRDDRRPPPRDDRRPPPRDDRQPPPKDEAPPPPPSR